MAQQLGSNYYNSPYKFNGKELDEETGLYYYGARYYSPRESIWLSVDPMMEKYSNMSPYNFCFDNPVKFVDPDGRDPGDYYSKNGEYLGKDKYNDNKVYVAESVQKDKNGVVTCAKSSTDLTNDYGITHSDFFNRANWVYGEGGGNYTDHYAHAIKNLKEHGVWGPANKPFKSDEAMFKSKMTHKSGGKILNMYPGYFNGTDGNFNSKNFANLRVDLNELSSNTGMRYSIQSVIGSLMGTTKDPTNGAYQWVGGAGENGPLARNPVLNNATNVTNVVSGDGKGQRYHTFYELLKE